MISNPFWMVSRRPRRLALRACRYGALESWQRCDDNTLSSLKSPKWVMRVNEDQLVGLMPYPVEHRRGFFMYFISWVFHVQVETNGKCLARCVTQSKEPNSKLGVPIGGFHRFQTDYDWGQWETAPRYITYAGGKPWGDGNAWGIGVLTNGGQIYFDGPNCLQFEMHLVDGAPTFGPSIPPGANWGGLRRKV